MAKGILLIALGNPIYGQMAFNLAMSIKAEDPKTEIALFYTDSAISTLKEWHTKVFDHFYVVPEEAYMVDGKPQYQRCKLLMYHFSPFDETLYLDVDALWCPNRKARWLMSELEDYNFTIGCGGFLDIGNEKIEKNQYTFWGEWQEILKHHKITGGRLWQTWSAVVWFKKDPAIERMFELALEVYDDPDAPCKEWAGGKPDEYCFNVAMALCNIEPHEQCYVPVYNTFIGGVKNPDEIKKQFWGFGMTGHQVRPTDEETYNKWVNQLCVKFNIPDRFHHVNKKNKIVERSNA